MLNTLNEVNKRIEIITNLLPSFNTDERKEIKKNNKLIKELTEELTNYKILIYNELKTKKEKTLPKRDLSEEEYENKIKTIKKELDYLTDNSYISKLELDKYLYDIENSDNFETINNSLNKILNTFKEVGISLSKEDFKYSITSYKYMEAFLSNKNKEKFNTYMKEIFDLLYWENPNLIHHLSLAIRTLLNKHKKVFENYLKSINKDKDYNDTLNNYYNLVIEYDTLKYSNKYLNYNMFLTKNDNIDDYLNNSPIKKEIISTFIDYDKYNNYTKQEKNTFHKETRTLYHSVKEYEYLTNFNYLTKEVKDIYKQKDSYKTSLITLDKTISKLIKEKDKISNKLFRIYPKLDKNNMKLNNKYNDLFNKENSKILEIMNTYKEYDKTLFQNEVITKIDDNKTYYDALYLYNNNYAYLMTLLKENNGNIEEYYNYINSPYLVISKNLLLNSDIDIKETLTKKYSLFNINFDLEDKEMTKLKQNLTYIYKLSYFEETDLDLNEIKLITEINKINE